MSRNRLAGEQSPYLLQHKDNPVWWYPWGQEAFDAARRESKPIFLSIGYSSCYWCHVMEKDSFESPDVAALLNEGFISIKLDREERPDVDQLYMQAVMGMTGHGGWPMSMFLTPQLEPFWGGTFFYRPQFIAILQQLKAAWQKDREQVMSAGASLRAYLCEQREQFSAVEMGQDVLQQAFADLSQSFDPEWGGFGQQPKFPPSAQLGLLLRLHRRSGNATAQAMCEKTLYEMAAGGMYDQVGGGFHRYSTDREWLVPHFEKMLYDNALLAVTYFEAGQAFANNTWTAVGKEILTYLTRDLRSPEGAFFSAEDAGEVGREGEFYVWEQSEIADALSPAELQAVSSLCSLSEEGNFENGKIILRLKPHVALLEKWKEPAAPAIARLLAERSRRRRPFRDEKILTAWNALAISALCKGYQTLGVRSWLEQATSCASFIKTHLDSNQNLLRRYRGGDARFAACIEDYAFLIAALLDLYECDFDPAWALWAKDLQERQDRQLWDEAHDGYFYSESAELIARRKEFVDNATPSGNSMALSNLLRLELLFGEGAFRQRAERLLSAFSGLAAKHPIAVPRALHALDFMLDGAKEVVVIRSGEGAPVEEFLRRIRTTFTPNKVVLCVNAADASSSPFKLLKQYSALKRSTFMICSNHVCSLPTEDVEQAMKLAGEHSPLVLL